MQDKKGKIMNKDEFLAQGSFAKEQYEGLLVGADSSQDCYNIGIQLSEDKVLVVDQARSDNVRERQPPELFPDLKSGHDHHLRGDQVKT
jgi:hypothetical protein